MSDQPIPAASLQPPSRRGQALVETALMLPVILILLLGAIDFGRLFFSYVTLHQAARIVANAASVDPATDVSDIPALIADEDAVMSCDPLDAPVLVYTRAGIAVTDAEIGDYAQVELSCQFSLITPLATQLFNGPIEMRATASFPVRTGCLGCSPGTGGGLPPPPPPEQCRTLPNMVGMSVLGARHAWGSAGFIGSFTPAAGQDTETVAPTPVLTPPDTLECPVAEGLAVFNASVTVTTEPAGTGPSGCAVLPNLTGMTITEARDAWADSAFTGDMLPPLPDADPLASVTAQEAQEDDGTPLSPQPVPGVSCLDPSTPPMNIEVTVGSAWPPPPDPPCQVPHMIDKVRGDGEQDWMDEGFDGSFTPANGGWVIKSQSIPGFSWVPCSASITVSQHP